MYKEIAKWVILIISQPAKAWEMLAEEKDEGDTFLSRFVYPLIGLVTVTAFLGVLFTRKEFDVQLALKGAIRALLAGFGGFYLAAHLMNEIWQGVYKQTKDLRLWQRFIGYASSLMFALNIVMTLLPEFFFLKIFVLYTFYIVWEGVIPFMKIDESERMKFAAITTVVILLVPAAIDVILFVLMPGLRF